MQIVIDIPEEIYMEICRNDVTHPIFKAIKNGMPLSKGHEDLIDRKELLENKYKIDSMHCIYDEVVNVDDIKDAPTIIKPEAPSRDLTSDPSAEIEADGFITWSFDR